MTFDPTTNRVQWYMLTDEEKTAMQAWPYGWEFMGSREWETTLRPLWFSHDVYRGKPVPVVKSTWLNIYPEYVGIIQYKSRARADENADTSRIAVLRRDTFNGVTTAYLDGV